MPSSPFWQEQIDAAVKAERERCAQIAEHLNGWGSDRKTSNELAAHIAKVIRGQEQ